MESIDIVCLGFSGAVWNSGECVSIDNSVEAINDFLEARRNSKPKRMVMFCDREGFRHARLLAENSKRVAADVQFVHRHRSEFLLDYVNPISYFNLFDKELKNGMSWKVSFKACLVSTKVLDLAPLLDSRFRCVDDSILDWGYRLFKMGVVMFGWTEPEMASWKSRELGGVDQYYFLRKYYGAHWLYWTAFRRCLSSGGRFWEFFSIRKLDTVFQRNIDRLFHNNEWTCTKLIDEVERKVTVIIPTVERYPYLFKLLDQLLDQTILPFEVFVIDQTPDEKRQVIEKKKYEKIGFRLITQEQSGQCSSRNRGLLESSGNYILFLDDDDEVQGDLIEKHLKCLQYFKADASCGVCDEVGGGPIPKEYSSIRMSDVFSTNNSMVRREVLLKSALFDLTHNRGQKADGDLGARLFLVGAIMVLNPDIRVLHHRAPSGGLRKHNVRKVTFSSSRRYITHFRLPHVTELYFNKKYFTEIQQREHLWITLLGTFSSKGRIEKRFLKVIWALLNLPLNVYKITKRSARATELLYKATTVPKLLK